MPEPHAGELTPLKRYVRMAFFGEPKQGNELILVETLAYIKYVSANEKPYLFNIMYIMRISC